jgi:hypothetical protein
VQQLDEYYFADTVIQLTVALQSDTFYFYENLNGGLNTPALPRLVQIHRIRVQFANSGAWVSLPAQRTLTTWMCSPASSQLVTPQAATSGADPVYAFWRGLIQAG